MARPSNDDETCIRPNVLKISVLVSCILASCLFVAMIGVGARLSGTCKCVTEDGDDLPDLGEISRLRCSAVPVTNHSHIVSQTGRAVGDTARLGCDQGFYPEGEDTSVCQKNLRWSAVSLRCHVIVCPLPLALGPLRHGRMSVFGGHAVGDKATFTCDEGYNLTDASEAECQANGTWSPVIACEPYDCGALQHLTNGIFWPEDYNTTYGSVVQFRCDPGFKLVGPSERVCRMNAEWAKWEPEEVPECQSVHCKEALDITNGAVDLSDTRYGSTATYRCDEGYSLTGGDSSRRCGPEGAWSGEAPSCVPVDCGTPPVGDEWSTRYTSTTYGATAYYGCGENYTRIGPAETHCTAKRSWSEDPPTCELSCLPLPKIDKGSLQTSGGDGWCSTATYSCHEDYRLEGGPARRDCGCHGWSDNAIPSCVRIPTTTTTTTTREPRTTDSGGGGGGWNWWDTTTWWGATTTPDAAYPAPTGPTRVTVLLMCAFWVVFLLLE